ncbi:MAG TPA: hypothetical protein VGK03_13915 [Geothrix sp.]
MVRFLTHSSLACVCSLAIAQGVPSQLNMGGFQLGQVIRLTEKKFGKPYVVRTSPDDWLINAFWTSDKHEHLMIFESAPPRNDRITSIQLFGKPTPGDPGIGGISLGSSESDVIKAFGAPSVRKVYEDEGKEYTRLEFNGKNYTVELNKDGLVVSIKLYGFNGFPKGPGDLPTSETVIRALTSGEARAFSPLLAPDFEIYRDGKIIRYEGPASDDIGTNVEIRDALFGPMGLKAALAGKNAEEDPQMRITEDKQIFHVIKYPKSPLLKEIVFTSYAGSWRIYEVSFRK